MPPDEVLDRLTERQMIRLTAYQNLYGPITLQRLDLLFARLGMDVAAPHMKKGRRPQLIDHLLQWSRKAKPRKTPEQIMGVFESMARDAEKAEKAEAARQEKREKKRQQRERRREERAAAQREKRGR